MFLHELPLPGMAAGPPWTFSHGRESVTIPPAKPRQSRGLSITSRSKRLGCHTIHRCYAIRLLPAGQFGAWLPPLRPQDAGEGTPERGAGAPFQRGCDRGGARGTRRRDLSRPPMFRSGLGRGQVPGCASPHPNLPPQAAAVLDQPYLYLRQRDRSAGNVLLLARIQDVIGTCISRPARVCRH